MNFPCPLSFKGLMSPRKKTWDLLHCWQYWRRDITMLDRALICGFYKPELVNAQRYFHSLQNLKTPNNPQKNSLSFRRSKAHLFSYLVRKVRKRLNYHLPNAPSKAAYSLSFMSVKESKITQKEPFDYKEWGLQQ